MSQRFHLVVSDVHPANKDFVCKSVGAKMWVQKSSFVLSILISF